MLTVLLNVYTWQTAADVTAVCLQTYLDIPLDEGQRWNDSVELSFCTLTLF